MANSSGQEITLVCVGNLTVDEARYGSRSVAPALGGDAAYAALAARLFIGNVVMLAPVGHDVPAELLAKLREAGVRADDLPERDRATVRNVITYHDDGSRIWDMLSTEEDFDVLSVYPSDVPESALKADGFVLSAMSLNSQLALTPWLREHSAATLYLDLQEDYLEGNREALKAMIGCCDVFRPSEVEAVALSGTSDLTAAAQMFRAWGPSTIIIKRAEHGSLLLDGDRIVTVPTALISPVDSTGAGDAFCGGFAAVHLATGDAVRAVQAGARAAQVAISDFGIEGLVRAARLVQQSGNTLMDTVDEGVSR